MGGIPEPFMFFIRPIMPFMLAPVTIFIILRVWSNCLMSLFTSWMLVPDPDAIRRRRCPSS